MEDLSGQNPRAKSFAQEIGQIDNVEVRSQFGVKTKSVYCQKKNNIAKTDSNHIYSKLIRKKQTQNHVNLRWNKKKRKNRKRKENKADLKSSSSKSNRTYLDLIIRHNPIFVLISYLTRLYVLETKFHVLDNRISKAYL